MSVPFSEDLWQRLSGLWRRDKKEEEEAVGYDDPQLKQMLDVMMVSRRSMISTGPGGGWRNRRPVDGAYPAGADMLRL